MVTVIVDRGYSMSTRDAQATRAIALLSEVSGVVRKISPDHEKLGGVAVPQRQGTGSSSLSVINVPTALDTRELIDPAVRDARRNAPANVVLVLTDQPSSVQDDRVIRVTPTTGVRNAHIVTIAARETPSAEVMVRLRGGPGFGAAKLRVTSGEQRVERNMRIPESGETNEFIDLPRLASSVKAELLIDDDQPADNAAWLAREASWPRMEARIPLPAHLRRFVDVYAKQRPRGEASKRVVIVPSVGDLPGDGPGVVLRACLWRRGMNRPAQPIIADHPVTKGVTWAEVGRPALASDAYAGGLDADCERGRQNLGRRPGAAGPRDMGRIRYERVGAVAGVRGVLGERVQLGRGGRSVCVIPGRIARRCGLETGRVGRLTAGDCPAGAKTLARAVPKVRWNISGRECTDVPIPAPSAKSDWPERLAGVEKRARQVDLAPAFAAAALVCLALAAWTWKRKDASRPVVA